MQSVIQKPQGQTALQDYSIARALREFYPNAKLRVGFRTQPYLETVKLGDVLASGLSTEKFFSDCRALPSCGEVQIKRLRSILEELAARIAAQPNEPQNAQEALALPFQGSFYPDFLTAWESVYQRMWRLSHFEKFVYLPSSIPEFVKSPAVLRAEMGQDADVTAYLAGMTSMRNALRLYNVSSGMVALDRQRLDMMFERRGKYAKLSAADLAQQHGQLTIMLENLSHGIDFKVLDTEAAYLSCGTIMGEFVTIAAMGGYIVTHDAPLAGLLSQRAITVAEKALPLTDYLEAL